MDFRSNRWMAADTGLATASHARTFRYEGRHPAVGRRGPDGRTTGYKERHDDRLAWISLADGSKTDSAKRKSKIDAEVATFAQSSVIRTRARRRATV